MTTIADAYVELHISGDKIEGEVRKAVKGASAGAEKDAEASGTKIGSKMGGGFLKGFADRNKDSNKIGRRIGARVASGFLSGLGAIKTEGSQIGKQFGEAFSGLGKLKLPAIGALVPLATSGISALTGALTAFVGAIAQAGGASLSFIGVLGSLIQAKIVAGIAFADFAKAAGGNAEALAKLSPAARAAAKAAGNLGGEWGKVRKAIQEEVFAGLDKVIARVGKVTLPALQKGFVGTGRVMNDVLKRFGAWVTSEGFVKRFGTAVKGNNKILGELGKAAVPLLKGILNVFIALQPAALRLAKKIRDVARNFREWSAAEGTVAGIKGFMDRAWKSAGNLWKVVRNLGSILRNVFGAATPAGDGLLKTFVNLTNRLRAFTELASTKNAIAKWAQEGISVSGTLFKGLGKGFMLIKGLFDPSILGGFMSVFAGLMPTITAVVKTIQSALKPVLDAVIGGFAKNGPKFAALFGALAPLLKGVGSVIGEIITQALDLLGTVASVITPVVAAISGWLGPVLTRFAPIIAAIILALGPSGLAGGLVKLVPVIGRFIAPLVHLAVTLFKIVGPALKVASKIFAVVFKGIAKVVGVSMKLVSKFVVGYFKIVFGVIKLYLRVIFAIVKFVWKGISAVIGGVVKVVWGLVSRYFRLYFKVISTVLRIIRKIVVTTFNAIRSVISKVLGVVRGIISRAFNFIRNASTSTWRAIANTVSVVWTAIGNTVSKGIARVVGFIRNLPGKILSAATAFANAGRELGSKVIGGLMDGLRETGGFLADLGSSIKNAINSALHLPVKIKGPGPLPDFTIPAFARGTNFAPGGVALVGERGPEIVHVPRGSRVDTAQETKSLLGRQITQNVSVVQNVRGGRGTPLRELNWAMKYGTGIKRLQEAT